MEHFDFWHTNIDLRKKETKAVFIWSFSSLDRLAAQISVYIEFLLSFQTICLVRPIRFYFQIGLEFWIAWEKSADLLVWITKLGSDAEVKISKTTCLVFAFFSWNDNQLWLKSINIFLIVKIYLLIY